MGLYVKRVTAPADLDVAKQLRYQVFSDEQGFDRDIEIDAYDALPTTWHFLGQDSDTGEYVAVARVLLDENHNKAKIGRVAVLAKCRGKSFGAALMSGVETLLPEWVETCALGAQLDKAGFYAKCGYERLDDEVYLDEGVPHCMMVKLHKQ